MDKLRKDALPCSSLTDVALMPLTLRASFLCICRPLPSAVRISDHPPSCSLSRSSAAPWYVPHQSLRAHLKWRDEEDSPTLEKMN